ncbi:hypothetical protein V8E53_004922 [Lactarius tabidus]
MNSHCPVHSRFAQHIYDSTDPFANICLCLQLIQPVELSISAEGTIYTQLRSHLPAASTNIGRQSTTTPPDIATVNRGWQCSICVEWFARRQERDRHLLAHVPYFLHCPLSHCAWRGNRVDTFKKHWQQEDHHRYHEQYGRTPEQSQIETYDPWPILNQLTNGAISPHEAEEQAIVLVQAKAYELQKPTMGRDPWGRMRHLMTHGEVPGKTQTGM